MLAEMVNITRETVRQILHDELKMSKVCAKMVMKNLKVKVSLKGTRFKTLKCLKEKLAILLVSLLAW